MKLQMVKTGTILMLFIGILISFPAISVCGQDDIAQMPNCTI